MKYFRACVGSFLVSLIENNCRPCSNAIHCLQVWRLCCNDVSDYTAIILCTKKLVYALKKVKPQNTCYCYTCAPWVPLVFSFGVRNCEDGLYSWWLSIKHNIPDPKIVFHLCYWYFFTIDITSIFNMYTLTNKWSFIWTWLQINISPLCLRMLIIKAKWIPSLFEYANYFSNEMDRYFSIAQ